MKFEVWMEGWAAMEERGRAFLLGTAEADTFREAVENVCAEQPLGRYLDAERLTLWGCRLFDNETEARAEFG